MYHSQHILRQMQISDLTRMQYAISNSMHVIFKDVRTRLNTTILDLWWYAYTNTSMNQRAIMQNITLV
jgi:hypothetical protein